MAYMNGEQARNEVFEDADAQAKVAKDEKEAQKVYKVIFLCLSEVSLSPYCIHCNTEHT